MSISKWAYTPEKCDGDYCFGDCDFCPKAEESENEKEQTSSFMRGFITGAKEGFSAGLETAKIDKTVIEEHDQEWIKRIKILIKVYENKIERSKNRAEYCDKKECEEAILEGKLSYFQIKTYEIMIEDLKNIIDGVL